MCVFKDRLCLFSYIPLVSVEICFGLSCVPHTLLFTLFSCLSATVGQFFDGCLLGSIIRNLLFSYVSFFLFLISHFVQQYNTF